MISDVEIKCILERKEYRFTHERNRPKGIWVRNNSLLTVWWVSVDNSIFSEKISISSFI